MKPKKEVGIGLVGAGTVGSEVIRIVDESRDELAKKTGVLLGIKGIHTRSPDKESLKPLQMYTPERFVGSVDELYNDPEIQIIVETMGGIDSANKVILDALKSNKSVVTANKDLIATYGNKLIPQANKKGLALRYEAAVAGGIPIVSTVEKGVVGDTIKEIRGIMNGTCNYMLTELENGGSYEDMLKKAQDLGYAESDPTNDVEGIDTAYKLAILVSLGFGKDVPIEDMDIEGISKLTEVEFMYAKQLGKKIKLLGVVSQVRQQLSAYVSPVLLDQTTSMAKTDGVLNAIQVIGQNASTFYNGPGAGGAATASAIVSDVMNVARFITKDGYQGPMNYRYVSDETSLVEAENVATKYYCRFYIDDRPQNIGEEISAQPGIVQKISEVLTKYSLNIIEIRQHDHTPEEKADLPFVITLEEAKNGDVKRAMQEIYDLGYVNREPFTMKILD